MISAVSTSPPSIYNIAEISLVTLTIFRFSPSTSTADWPGLGVKNIFSTLSSVDFICATSSTNSGVLNRLLA